MDDTILGTSDGINSVAFHYHGTDDGQLSLAPAGGSSVGSPDPAVTAQAGRFGTAMRQVRRYDFDDGLLLLQDAGGRTLLEYRKA